MTTNGRTSFEPTHDARKQAPGSFFDSFTAALAGTMLGNTIALAVIYATLLSCNYTPLALIVVLSLAILFGATGSIVHLEYMKTHVLDDLDESYGVTFTWSMLIGMMMAMAAPIVLGFRYMCRKFPTVNAEADTLMLQFIDGNEPDKKHIIERLKAVNPEIVDEIVDELRDQIRVEERELCSVRSHASAPADSYANGI